MTVPRFSRWPFAVAGFRRFTARHRWLRWALIVCLAAVAATEAQQRIDALAAQRRAWGDTAPVVVALERSGAGERLTAGRFGVRRWPKAIVPMGALDHLPGSGTLAVAIPAGAPLLDTMIVERLPDRRRVVVPVDHPSRYRPGDRADILAVDGAGTEAAKSSVLAVGGLVVESLDDAVVIDVAEGDATRVTAAIASGGAAVVAWSSGER